MALSIPKISVFGAYRSKIYAALIQAMCQGMSCYCNLHFESVGSGRSGRFSVD